MPIQPTSGRPKPRPRTVRPKRTYTGRLTLPSRLQHEPRIKPNKILGAILLLVAIALVPTHLAEHAGTLDVLPGNLEDLLLGFPMAAVLGIAAFIAFIWK